MDHQLKQTALPYRSRGEHIGDRHLHALKYGDVSVSCQERRAVHDPLSLRQLKWAVSRGGNS